MYIHKYSDHLYETIFKVVWSLNLICKLIYLLEDKQMRFLANSLAIVAPSFANFYIFIDMYFNIYSNYYYKWNELSFSS
jgi:hypothetical protein